MDGVLVKPSRTDLEVEAGDVVTVLDWRFEVEFDVPSVSKVHWDTDRECWAFDYDPSYDGPGYAVWVEDHWEDGED